MVDAHKGHSGRHRSVIISENIWNLRVRLEKSLRKSTRRLSQEAGEEKESRYDYKYLPTRWSTTPLFK